MIEIYGTDQSTTETRTHYIDFSNDMPSGVTVSDATATLSVYPTGGTATLTVGVIASNIVPVKVTTPTIAGKYIVDVLATLSDAQTSAARLIIQVFWQSARSGLTDLIGDLRLMADAGANDFTIAGQPYWTDKQLERELDRVRSELYRQPLEVVDTYNNGTVEYKQYYCTYGNFEQTTGGTTIFWLENAAGTILGTSLYTVNYQTGHVSFGSDTTGSAVYLYGRSYDLNAAAANIWRFKAANVAKLYDFSTDNHSLHRSQAMKQYLEMARYFEGMRQPESISMYREDIR